MYTILPCIFAINCFFCNKLFSRLEPVSRDLLVIWRQLLPVIPKLPFEVKMTLNFDYGNKAANMEITETAILTYFEYFLCRNWLLISEAYNGCTSVKHRSKNIKFLLRKTNATLFNSFWFSLFFNSNILVKKQVYLCWPCENIFNFFMNFDDLISC